ncbi:NADH dehydrogenase [ubiquinone] 1 alpha subcomplex assembly factor 3 [Kalmusia sp. IMI 367209]|nr:NADH dehydrogenase [ubiquinone] 1 alpha subcomplex assembly factor 3 [Kalmusia sp. IMI 367209]
MATPSSSAQELYQSSRTNVTLASPPSPPPTYSPPHDQLGPEPADVALGTMHTINPELFEQFSIDGDDIDDDSGEIEYEDDIPASVLEHFHKLDEQLDQRPVPQSSQPVPETPFPLLRLPLELREQIYAEYFNPRDRLETFELDVGPTGNSSYRRYNFEFGLLRTSKQVYLEAVKVWRMRNVFLRLETPWPTAGMVHHISSEGHVPIVAAGARADLFNQHTSLVQITAPLHSVIVPEHTLILLLDDLPLFTKVWYYSALSYANLNPQICLSFILRDPYYPADPKPISLAMQRKLLLPFGDVKGLYETKFEEYDEGIAAELRQRMAVPYPTIQECCEQSATMMEEGDHLFAEKHFQDALDTYVKSFDAIHIKVSGRSRRVLADHFFADDITEGRFAGQAGMTVRVILRIRLVARVVRTYLHLGRPEEAAFWGIRSIKIMREDRGTAMENFFTEFMQTTDVAQIFIWTATALTQLRQGYEWVEERKEYEGDEVANCDHMWRRAGRYLAKLKFDGERRSMYNEAREFGVTIPDFAKLTDNEDDDFDVSSMSHLNLGAAEN